MKGIERLHLRMTREGVIVPVKAVAGASRDKVIGVLGDRLKISTSSAPEKGQANAAIARALADVLGIDRRRVTLRSGPTNPRKEFLVPGLSAQEVRSRLGKL